MRRTALLFYLQTRFLLLSNLPHLSSWMPKHRLILGLTTSHIPVLRNHRGESFTDVPSVMGVSPQFFSSRTQLNFVHFSTRPTWGTACSSSWADSTIRQGTEKRFVQSCILGTNCVFLRKVHSLFSSNSIHFRYQRNHWIYNVNSVHRNQQHSGGRDSRLQEHSQWSAADGAHSLQGRHFRGILRDGLCWGSLETLRYKKNLIKGHKEANIANFLSKDRISSG